MQKNNILIITFDCLRPDHLGAMGYKGVKTPTFDHLINEGITFTNSYCQAPNTWISHASLFTGCQPYCHGVRTPVRKISRDIRTMAEVFREVGYATFGLPAMSLLSQEGGFSRGFDEYILDGLESQPGALEHRYYRSDRDTLEISQNWLRQTKRPFFAWLHHFGTHKVDPDLLDLPEQYRRQYSEYAQYFDGKIAYADECFLGPLVAEMKNLGILDETILVLWSDHGEDLHLVETDSPYWGHNWYLSEEVMRTLLSIRAPGLLPMGEKRADLAQSIDIFPTLLDLAGLETSLDQLQGRSLRDNDPQANPSIYMENLCQGFVGLREGPFKLILMEPDPDSQQDQTENSFFAKISWRWELFRETWLQLLPEKLRPSPPTPDPLRLWWRTRGEPEQVFQRLLVNGKTQLFQFLPGLYGEQQVELQNTGKQEELKQSLAQSTSVISVGEDADLSLDEEELLRQRLKNLGYM